MFIFKSCLEKTYNTSLGFSCTNQKNICLTILGLRIFKSVH